MLQFDFKIVENTFESRHHRHFNRSIVYVNIIDTWIFLSNFTLNVISDIQEV